MPLSADADNVEWAAREIVQLQTSLRNARAQREKAEAHKGEFKRQANELRVENERLRAVVETAAAMVRQADPVLADALLRRLAGV